MDDFTDITHDLTLLSGLIVSMREPTLNDVRVLSGRRKEAERKLSPKSIRDPLAECFAGMTKAVVDEGPYSGGSTVRGGVVNWNQALQGDTSMALLEIRRAMFTEESLGHDGDIFTCELECQSLTCKLGFGWQIRLSELDRHGLSPEAEERFRQFGPEMFDARTEGEPDPFVHIRLPRSGRLVRWKLLTRADQYQADLAAKGDPDHLEEHGLLARIPYIAGLSSQVERRKFLTHLPWADQEVIRRTWREHDCWIQDMLEVKCPHCGQGQKFAIPLGDDFFSLSSVGRLETNSLPSSDSSSSSATINSEEAGSGGAGASA